MHATTPISTPAIATDDALSAAALDGDRSAFRLIVERYQNLVCSIAFSALGDVGRSEDLAQETFVIAWRNLGTLKEPAKLKGWLCGIARRLISNYRRRDSTDVVVRAEAIGDRDPVADDAVPPLEVAIRREEEVIVWEVLSNLPPQFREPLVLYHRGQQSVAEVASQLDLSEDAVKQRLARGRKLLKVEVAAFVEKALRESRPGTAFAAAVLAALPAAAPQALAAGLVVTAKGAGTKAAAAGITATAGAILGPMLGLVGAAFGIMAGITSARSPRERKFMIQMTLLVVGLVATLLAVQATCIHFIPATYRTIPFQSALWGVYAALLLGAILWGKRRTQQIRDEDGTATASSGGVGDLRSAPLRSVTWGLAGMMYGAVCWIGVAGASAGDWLAPTMAFALTAIAWQVIKRWLESSDTIERRILAMLIGVVVVAAISIAVGSLRWSTWQAAPGHFADRLPLWSINLIILSVSAAPVAHLLIWLRKVRRQPE